MSNEMIVRGVTFLAFFALLAVWELVWPRRPLTAPKVKRWLSNLGLALINGVTQSLLLPLLPAGMALIVQERGWGLFNYIAWPAWLEVALVVLILDLVIYAQHVAFHVVPFLSRFHQVHHTDLDLDVTSSVRFHFGEGLISALLKLGMVIALGATPIAVLIFELVLNLMAMFNHSNIYLPVGVDRILRYLFVTPDMHRVHHSIIKEERLSNYGFSLSWWDYLFGTYRDQPSEGQLGMTIGLPKYQDARSHTLVLMLSYPFWKAG